MIVCIGRGEGRGKDWVTYDMYLLDEKNPVWKFSLHMLSKSPPRIWGFFKDLARSDIYATLP